MNYNEKDFTKEQWEIIKNIEDYVDEFDNPELDFVPQKLKDKWIKIKQRDIEIKKEMEELHQYYLDVKADKIVPYEGKEKFIKTYELAIKNIKEADEKRAERNERFRTFDERCLNPAYLPGGYFTSEEFLALDEMISKDIRKFNLLRCRDNWKVKKYIYKNRYNIDWLNPEERYDRGLGRVYISDESLGNAVERYMKRHSDDEKLRINLPYTYYLDFIDDPDFLCMGIYDKESFFNYLMKIWDFAFDLCKDYYIKNNNLNIPFNYSIEDVDLGRWLESQKIIHKKGKLPADKVKMLESINIDWE